MRIRVLGRCEIEHAGQIVPLRHKAAELIGLLVVKKVPVSRAELAATLWPDAFDADARHNLRQTLLTVRNRLAECQVLTADSGLVALAPETTVDLWERDGRWKSHPAPDELKSPEAFLAPLSSDWVVAFRAEQNRLAVEVALREGEASLTIDPSRALAFARASAHLEPLLEAPRDLAVRASLKLGHRTQALAEIASFEAALRREFGSAVSHRLGAHLGAGNSFDLYGLDLDELGPNEMLALAVAAMPALARRPADARRVLREALAKAVDADEDHRARAEVELARLAMMAGDVYEAEAGAARAHSMTDSPILRAHAETVRGRVLARTNRREEAREVLEAAREVAYEHRSYDLLAEIDTSLGACLIMDHQMKDAETVLARALVSAEKAGNRATIARIVFNRSVATMYAGRLDAAAAEIERYLPVAPPSFRAQLSMHLGRVREAQGAWVDAEHAYGEAVVALRAQGEPFYLAQALTYVADAALRRGDLAAARPAYEEAVALRRTSGDRLGLMTVYKGLGTVAHREGRLSSAETHLREALRFSIETGEPMAGASVRVALARVLDDAGRKEEALSEAKRARRGILGLRAEAASLTTDDTLSLEAVDDLVKRLGSCSAP